MGLCHQEGGRKAVTFLTSYTPGLALLAQGAEVTQKQGSLDWVQKKKVGKGKGDGQGARC